MRTLTENLLFIIPRVLIIMAVDKVGWTRVGHYDQELDRLMMAEHKSQ